MSTTVKPDYFCKDLPTHPAPDMGKVLVTGGTGYIGGRLIPELMQRGYKVRIMIRAPLPGWEERWPGAEVIVADALDTDALDAALNGIHTAFYLIHSLMLGMRKFQPIDIQAAVNFKNAAENNRLKHIIYLGGLGNPDSGLSSHLESRNLVAAELCKGTVPVTVLRAGMVIGSGSASYEILVNLVKNIPVFFIPYWAKTKSQPIAIRDVIKYLVGILEVKSLQGNNSFDIGGATVIRYDEKLRVMARLLHKKRWFIPALFSHPSIYGYLAGLLTPVPPPLTKVLVEGCINEVVCQNDDIRKLIPFEPLSFTESLERALVLVENDQVYTRWSDSYPYAHELQKRLHQMNPPPRYTSTYCKLTMKSAHSLFESFCLIGGKSGWFHSNWMWRLRGFADRILLGVGTSRGRRSASGLRANDVIDFFRVENIDKDKQLLLRAEMKVPGEAWLEFDIRNYEGINKLTVNAYFQPEGFFGHLYWYFLLPFHFVIFKDLIVQIEKRA